MTKGIRTDKLDTCSALLEDCIVGFFTGNSIQTTTHLAFAVMTIVRDLSNHYKKTLKDEWDFSTLGDSLSEDSELKIMFQRNQTGSDGYNFSLIDRANFVKHANMNPLAKNVFAGNEGSLCLTIAIEDYGNFYLALRKRNLCCQVSQLFDLPNTLEPKVITLARIYSLYEKEYKNIRESFDKNSDNESSLIAMDELKRKYADIIHQMDLAKGRSQYDQLVLFDSLDISTNPKPTASGLSPL